MYHLKSAYVLLLFSLSFGTASAQKSESADQMYQDLAYKEVIKLYESKDKLSVEDMERIANGYRLNHDTENAALWFEQVVAQNHDPINCLYYAQALQSNGAYEKAKKYFLRYNELLGSDARDQRGNYLAAAIDRMNDWKEEKEVVLKQEASVNSGNLDFSPAFYKDGVVFVSSRKLSDDKKYKWTDEHFMNLFYAPANKEGVLDSVQSFSKMINSKYHEGPVAFDKSFNRIFFTRNDHLHGKVKTNKKGVMKLGIFTALRDGDNWTEPKAIDFNTSEYEECHPSLTANGKYLYFASDREGGQGAMDIYVSEFNDGQWAEPTNLGPKVNTPGNDVFPFIHDDGTLYFASDGWGGMGGLDIFYSKKNETNQWITPANMGLPYNSRKDDFGFILNVLGTEGYLTSSREGGRGKDDIYSFKRSAEAIEQSKLQAARTDMMANEDLLEVANIEHNEKISEETNKEHNEKISEVTNTERDKKTPEVGYSTFEKKENLQANTDDKMSIELLGENPNNTGTSNTIVINIGKEKIGEPTVDKEKEYIFIVEKEGQYAIVSKPVVVSDREINTLKNLIENERIVIGEIFELKNVFYDFDKYDINKKAARELDHLIQIMQDNPTLEIELSAHTDSRGRTRYNQWLSRKRATGAVKYMTDRGLSPRRIVARGYGETLLRNNCGDDVDCEERDHRINRRTEIKILKK